MREIVIVIPDLYLDPGPEDPWASSTDTRANAREPVPAGTPAGAGALGSMPGFEHAARCGIRRRIVSDGGWRPWLSRWLGRPDLASHAPASIAAASQSQPVLRDAPASRSTPTVWVATPVHLIASLTNLHLDRRGLLRLPLEDRVGFAEDFNRTFGDADLHLQPLSNGEFLLRGPASWSAVTTEPARAIVSDLEVSLPRGNGGAALKRLGAELEMWLHSLALNDTRQRRGDLTLSTLWLWGGGPLESLRSASAPLTDLACGTDPYLAGLWHLQGAASRPLPDRFGDLLSDPKPERAVLVLEITPLLQTNPNWTVFEALVDLDRRYFSPALAALHSGALESVVLVANDMEVRLRRGDRLKFWRRARPGIGAILS